MSQLLCVTRGVLVCAKNGLVLKCWATFTDVVWLCRKTAHKDVVIVMQFRADYPQSPLILELKSKTITEKFLKGLVSVCDQELNRHIGKRQVCENVGTGKLLEDYVCDCIWENRTVN